MCNMCDMAVDFAHAALGRPERTNGPTGTALRRVAVRCHRVLSGMTDLVKQRHSAETLTNDELRDMETHLREACGLIADLLLARSPQ